MSAGGRHAFAGLAATMAARLVEAFSMDDATKSEAVASAPPPAARDSFGRAMRVTFGFEGGRSDHAADRGGRTNLGITQATYTAFCRRRQRPTKDVYKLAHAEAEEFYRLEFWDGPGVGKLPWPFSLLAFDAGVNSGQARGVKWVQEGLRLAADGRIGSRTIAAAEAAVADGDGEALLRCVEARARFLANLCQKNKAQIAFAEGWWIRTLTILAHALAGDE